MAHQFLSLDLPPFTDVLHTTVKPLEKTAHVETIDATILDSFFAEMFFPCLFAYRLGDKSDAVYSQTVKRIKESLSKVLIPFFSFAGRWVETSPGNGARKLLCNDEGVPFIEAYMDADIDSVVHASTAFQAVPELQGHSFVGLDVTQHTQQLPPGGATPIFVQVTRFKCGGLVLAVTFDHMHVDGQGFSNFMRAWSDLSRTNETDVKVDHNRAQLDVPSLAALFPDPGVVVTFKRIAKLGPWKTKVFEVDASTIKVLKEEAKSLREDRGYVSTGDCIAAQLMRSFEVLRPSVLPDKGVFVSRAVEGRARFLDHPVPDVCANFTTLLLPPEIPTDELLEMPLVSTARRFREKLETTKREDWLDSDVIGKSMGALANSKLRHVCLSSWYNFGMYEIDFGFGKPYVFTTPNSFGSTSMLAMAIVLPPIPSRSSSVATLNLRTTPDVLQALDRDPQFQQFFRVHEDSQSKQAITHNFHNSSLCTSKDNGDSKIQSFENQLCSAS